MARTRKSFGHDKPARAGAKNTIMYHQVLAFLPEECSCNGGKMTTDACMSCLRVAVTQKRFATVMPVPCPTMVRTIFELPARRERTLFSIRL